MRWISRSRWFQERRRRCRVLALRFSEPSDRGSGTAVGAALVFLIAVLLSAVAVGGQLLVCRSKAESAADGVALAVAAAHYDGVADPCGVAASLADGYGAMPRFCGIDGMDVEVTVAVDVAVPWMSEVTARSRAGPESCS